MNKPDLSIIIISYNTKQITKNCLDSIVDSLKGSKLTVEVIVIDNGSTDGSKEMLEKFQSFPLRSSSFEGQAKFKTILNETNLGFGKSNNQGVRTAESNYILFLNSDILVLDDAVEKLYKFYKQNEKMINFLGGKLLNKDLTPQASCGPNYSLMMVFTHLFFRGDYWGLTRYSPNRIKEVDWVSGACILTKKKCLQNIKGFDEGIFLYMEEIDLLYRAKKHGFRVFFYPEARFIHLGSASTRSRKYPILQVYRGLIYFYRKHYSVSAQFLLKIMLKFKALVGLTIGKIANNKYLKETYEEAYKISNMD